MTSPQLWRMTGEQMCQNKLNCISLQVTFFNNKIILYYMKIFTWNYEWVEALRKNMQKYIRLTVVIQKICLSFLKCQSVTNL